MNDARQRKGGFVNSQVRRRRHAERSRSSGGERACPELAEGDLARIATRLALTSEMAARQARYFGTSEQFKQFNA